MTAIKCLLDSIGTHQQCACCPLCKSNDSWEHVFLCGKMENIREVWINMMQKKLNKTAKKVKVSTHARKIVNETIKDIRKNFDGERNFGLTSKCWV